MTAETTDSKGLNIFLFLAKLEQDGIKVSDQNKATILSKLNYQETQYNNQIANWKDKSDAIGKAADKAQHDANKSGGFFSSTFGKLVGFLCIIVALCIPFVGIFVAAGVGVALGEETNMFNFSSQDHSGDQGKFQEAVQNANEAQTKVQQTQQKMSSIENLDLNSQQQNQQSMQNMFNSMIKNFGTMGSYNSRG